MKVMRNVLLSMCIIAGFTLCALLPVNTAEAFGKAKKHLMSQLSAEWWQWAVSIPKSVNPVGSDDTGELAMVGQHGDVWFLAGSFSTDPIVRNVTIPENNNIFFPVINYICSAFFPDGTNEQELRTCAKNGIDLATEHTATLNGKDLKLVRVQSPLFMASFPPNNVFTGLCDNCDNPDPNPSASISDGYWGFIRHLSVGKHTIVLHGKQDFGGGNTFEQNVTYNVTVVPVGFPIDTPAVTYRGPKVFIMGNLR